MDSPFGHSPARLGNPAGNTSVSSVNLAGAPLEVVLGQYQNSLVAYETTHRQLHELVNKLQKKVKKTTTTPFLAHISINHWRGIYTFTERTCVCNGRLQTHATRVVEWVSARNKSTLLPS